VTGPWPDLIAWAIGVVFVALVTADVTSHRR
jgi:hypothetical protein